eukprot:TRINITY_DN1465_c0_g1_i40.p2 TRINITY_DN1465_c0_g1~~TRINITY_DN1465_c0_g1_i40.p2  ORF type:complete len:126 (-),score=30.99 TRINITY_DN1465_c0_g1_i40:552-929(-)
MSVADLSKEIFPLLDSVREKCNKRETVLKELMKQLRTEKAQNSFLSSQVESVRSKNEELLSLFDQTLSQSDNTLVVIKKNEELSNKISNLEEELSSCRKIILEKDENINSLQQKLQLKNRYVFFE